VIGLGGMGSAALANVAMRGASVVGLEQFERGHAYGSSSGRSRLIRKAYFEHENYVPLLLRAYEAWHHTEKLAGVRLFHKTSLLLAARPESEMLRGARRSASRHDLAVEYLTAKDMHDRFPMVRPLRDEVGILEPDGGFIAAEASVRAYLHLAQAHGAQLRFSTRVTGWTQRATGGVEIALSGGSKIEASRLIVCAGPWWRALGETPAMPIRLQRNVQVWFEPESDAFSIGSCPAFMLDREELPHRMYGFPDYGFGVKAAFHGLGPEFDRPEELDRAIGPNDVEPLRLALSAWMPGAAANFVEAKACTYSWTPDEHFVVGLHPTDAGVVVAGGFSGHGFKFVSVMGEVLADLALDGGTHFDLSFLSPNRFVTP